MGSEILFAIFILIGLVTGVLSGLLGIGGGVITVPALYYLLRYSEVPLDLLMQISVGTSLAVTFVTSFAAWISHHRKKSIFYLPIKILLPGLFIGCTAGSYVAAELSDGVLRAVFGSVGLLLGGYFLFPHLPNPHFAHSVNKTLAFFGVAIGFFSSILGIGGGIFTVPVLIGYQVPIKSAFGSSSLATLLTALFGTLTYLLIASKQPPLPSSFGFIHLPAFLTLAAGSVCTAPLGVFLSHKLPISLIKRIFGFVVILTGVTLLFHS